MSTSTAVGESSLETSSSEVSGRVSSRVSSRAGAKARARARARGTIATLNVRDRHIVGNTIIRHIGI